METISYKIFKADLLRNIKKMIVYFQGFNVATENQQTIINDVIKVKTGVYLHKTQI